MKIKVVISVLAFFSVVIFTNCDNPLEGKVNDLENQLNEQKQDNVRQQEILDSLMLELNNQKIQINSVAIERQRVIDSLTLLFNGKLDSMDTEQKALIDSLNMEQNKYIDSLNTYQQSLIETLLANQVNTETIDEEFYNGIIPTTWTQIDLSSKTGKEKTLVILRIDRLSPEGDVIVFRPNGETVDWLTTSQWLIDNPASLSIASLASPKSGYILVFTDGNGIVEMRANIKKDMTASVKLVFYLN